MKITGKCYDKIRKFNYSVSHYTGVWPIEQKSVILYTVWKRTNKILEGEETHSLVLINLRVHSLKCVRFTFRYLICISKYETLYVNKIYDTNEISYIILVCAVEYIIGTFR